jgi:hypothetical protein
MKKLIIFTCFTFLLLNLNAQYKVGLSFNQNYSTLRFLDSENNKEDLDFAVNYGYGLSYLLEFNDAFYGETRLAYNTLGANSTFGMQKLDWSFGYVNLEAYAGYKLDFRRLYPHFGAGAYYGRLMKADQFIGSDYYNLMQASDINKNDIGAVVFGGLDYEYSRDGSVFIRIVESIGLLNLEQDQEASQRMFNRTFSIQLGLYFNIQ